MTTNQAGGAVSRDHQDSLLNPRQSGLLPQHFQRLKQRRGVFAAADRDADGLEDLPGLDSQFLGSGAELMRTLRALAEGGTTVVLATHNPADADRCDKVAVLAAGGRLAFFGTLAQG